MKFSLIPHFLIGIFMYTNSNIFSQWLYEIRNSDPNNRYLNEIRFDNDRSSILFGFIALLLLFYLLKYTLYIVFTKIKGFFKKKKENVSSDKQVSNNFYQEIHPFKLFKEYKKSMQERENYRKIIKEGQFKTGNEKQLDDYVEKLNKKIKEIKKQFKIYFKKFNIQN